MFYVYLSVSPSLHSESGEGKGGAHYEGRSRDSYECQCVVFHLVWEVSGDLASELYLTPHSLPQAALRASFGPASSAYIRSKSRAVLTLAPEFFPETTL